MLNAPILNNSSEAPLDFLWIELTNTCNLQCKHCYSESSPWSGKNNKLSKNQYETIIKDAVLIGCRKLQFIGGEPTLNSHLQDYIIMARSVGYEFIEIFSNLIRIPDDLVKLIKEYGVFVATSVYGPSAHVHDSVTLKAGSFDRTIRNVDRLLEAGCSVRAGFIEMDENAGFYEQTSEFLKRRGVERVGYDRVRRFGRAGQSDDVGELQELCGSCSNNVACVGADGTVSPCIMSRKWSFGDVRHRSFAELVQSSQILNLRQQIYDATIGNQTKEKEIRNNDTMCHPCAPQGCFPCSPDATCSPCAPNSTCDPTHCNPYWCTPIQK